MSAALAVLAGILSSVLTAVVFVVWLLPRQLAERAEEARKRTEAEAQAAQARRDARQAQLAEQTQQIADRLLEERNRDSVDLANSILDDLRARPRNDDGSSR